MFLPCFVFLARLYAGLSRKYSFSPCDGVGWFAVACFVHEAILYCSWPNGVGVEHIFVVVRRVISLSWEFWHAFTVYRFCSLANVHRWHQIFVLARVCLPRQTKSVTHDGGCAFPLSTSFDCVLTQLRVPHFFRTAFILAEQTYSRWPPPRSRWRY